MPQLPMRDSAYSFSLNCHHRFPTTLNIFLALIKMLSKVHLGGPEKQETRLLGSSTFAFQNGPDSDAFLGHRGSFSMHPASAQEWEENNRGLLLVIPRALYVCQNGGAWGGGLPPVFLSLRLSGALGFRVRPAPSQSSVCDAQSFTPTHHRTCQTAIVDELAADFLQGLRGVGGG